MVAPYHEIFVINLSKYFLRLNENDIHFRHALSIHSSLKNHGQKCLPSTWEICLYRRFVLSKWDLCKNTAFAVWRAQFRETGSTWHPIFSIGVQRLAVKVCTPILKNKSRSELWRCGEKKKDFSGPVSLAVWYSAFEDVQRRQKFAIWVHTSHFGLQ